MISPLGRQTDPTMGNIVNAIYHMTREGKTILEPDTNRMTEIKWTMRRAGQTALIRAIRMAMSSISKHMVSALRETIHRAPAQKNMSTKAIIREA